MPVLDGLEAKQELNTKAQNGEVPPTTVVALSAGMLNNEGEVKVFQDLGFADYFTKPISRDNFLKLLRSYDVI